MPAPETRHDGTFAALLRQLRLDALLTQTALSERAGLSTRAIQHLEAGRGFPFADTTRRLGDALGLTGAARQTFESSARHTPKQHVPAPTTAQNAAGLNGNCPKCQGSNNADDQFCSACGTALRGPAATAGTDGEHKQATVLTCQITDIASLEQQVGAEAALDVMHRVLSEATQEVGRYGGDVSAVLGDRIVALFGVPRAYEDHARRAVLAALGIQRRLQFSVEEQPDSRLGRLRLGEHLRMALHTGWVAVGTIGARPDQRTTAVGETMARAAAMLELAEPGSIVITDATARLVTGFVRLEVIEPELGHAGEPALIHRVNGVGPRRSPLEGIGARSLSPFVGRDREMGILHETLAQVANTPQHQRTSGLGRFVGRAADLAVLQDMWTRGAAGHGQVVGLVGEPGMGKSRLAFEFRRSLANTRVTYLEGRCLSYGGTTPYLPIVDLVRANCGIAEADEPSTVADKVRFGLHEVGLDPIHHASCVLHLLGLAEGAAALTGLSPEVVKARTFETLRSWTLAGSQKRPIIMAIEDLHWIDPSSEEYLTTLVDSLGGAPIVLLCSWRPGYRPPWVEHSYVTQLPLQPLSPTDSVSLVGSILQAEDVTTDLVSSILHRAEGNPFFLEELARAVVHYPALRPDEALPDTIQGVLAARMDRLSEAPRRVLQTASAIGRELPLRLLKGVSDEPTSLVDALAELERLEFLYAKGAATESLFVFKHALTQETAYASMTQSRRRNLHQRIARVLAEQFAELAETQPELLGYHYTEAGLNDTAIGYWQRAGDRAAERSANVEAISHCRMALDLLAGFPDTPERAHRELTLQLALGGPLIATRGYGAPDTVAAYTRASQLAEGVKDPDLLFPLLYRRWVIHNIWAQHTVALDAAEQFLNLAEGQPRADLQMMGHRILGITSLFCGAPGAARKHLEQALELYNPRRDQALAYRYGQEPRASILAWLAVTLWLLGSEDQAVRMVDEAIEHAREVGHTNTLAYTLFYGGTLVHQLRGDPQAVARYADGALRLAREHQLSMWGAYATVGLGWARAAQGRDPDAVSSMLAGLAELKASGTGLLRPHLLGWLAEAQARCGLGDEALRVVDDALSTADATGERWCEPGLYLLKGKLFSTYAGRDSEAQRAFQRAAEIARMQGCVALERKACC